MGWAKVENGLPKAKYGDDRNTAPYLSEDVAVCWPEIGIIEIANYDHEAKHWSLPNKSFNQPDADPVYWYPLPKIPTK